MTFSDGSKAAISTAQSVQVYREYDERLANYPAAAGYTPGVAGWKRYSKDLAGTYTAEGAVGDVDAAGEVFFGAGNLTVIPAAGDADDLSALIVGDQIIVDEGGTVSEGTISAIAVAGGVYTITAAFDVNPAIADGDDIDLSTRRDRQAGAVRKFSAQDFMLREQLAQEMFDNERGYGIISRSNRAPVPTRNHTVLEQTSRMDFEQILLPLLAGLNGGVEPDWVWGDIGSGDDYTVAADAASVTDPGDVFVAAVGANNGVDVTIYPLAADLRYFKLIFGGSVDSDHAPSHGQVRLYVDAANYVTFDPPDSEPAPVSGVYTVSATNGELTGALATNDNPTLQGGAYQWQFDPIATGRPQLETFGFEYAESDLSSDGDFPRLMPFGYCMSIECTMGVEGVPQMRANYDGRIAEDIEELTPDLSAEDFPSAGALRTSVYFDDSWDDLGDTQVLGQVYNVSWNYTSHFFHQYYDDGREDMDFSTVHVRPRQIAVSADVLVDTATDSLVRKERALKRQDRSKGKRRYMRILWEGARINGITQQLQLDTVGVHADDSLSEYGGERDGNNITRISLMSIFDNDNQRDMRVVLRNGLSQFP